jgi:hypothetical protein
LAKDGKLMSNFESWLSGGKASGFLKTTVVSISFMADLTGLHYLIEGIKTLKKDPRTLKEIFFDTESEVEEIKKKFPINEKDGLIKTKKTAHPLTILLNTHFKKDKNNINFSVIPFLTKVKLVMLQ